MNISRQIRKFRERDDFSQENLAEKIYVSRQTISNWENGHSYPDIHNLMLLSVLFDVSLDELVKGDVEIMKKELAKTTWNKWAWMMLGFSVLAAISLAPVFKYMSNWGLLIPAFLWLLALGASLKIEKIKKENNIKTYDQVVAFTEGRPIEDVKSNRWKDFASYVGFPAVILVIALLGMFIFR